MNFGEVLSKAWKIIWKNKVLWIFGILSSCGRGGGGGGGGGTGNSSFPGSNSGDDPFSNGQLPNMDEFGRNIENFFGTGEQTWIPIAIGLFCLILILSVVFIFLGTIGRIGLIKGTLLAENNQVPLTFSQVWSVSTPFFWRVFLLNLVAGLAIFIAAMIIVIPGVFLSVLTMGIGFLCLIPLLCVFAVLIIVFNIILEQANVAMVVENTGIMDAFKRGWRVCRENIGPVLVVALVLLVGGGIIGFIIVLPVFLALLPIFAGVISNDESVLTGMAVTTGVMLCCLVPVVIAFQGILNSYIGSVWTLTYLRLTGKNPDEDSVYPVTEFQTNA
jgi:hypothetical protein